MKIPQEFFKAFPAYEDVFYDEIEQHRKHFLPICSINLQCVFPERDEWVHFVSAKAIYDGCVGEDTPDFHTEYTKEDMLGFTVIDGKYKFEVDWSYFGTNHEEESKAYLDNANNFQIRKEYYERVGSIYPYSSFGKEIQDVEELAQDMQDKQEKGWRLEYPAINGFLDDVAFKSEEMQKFMKEYDVSMEEIEIFGNTNLINIPTRPDGRTFTYIGALTGFYFQAYGADCLYLFYDRDLKKAVVCFEYT
ncbi:siderophore biosynthesis protein [Brevibacillus laterosporus]|uniref:Siderophore biosynthesis protein n=1 Tax=Brevibacillus halotolerans TaxID=1507437 RepID=A0ABT4HU37_9BACL|nr:MULTISPECIES: siderophore biosynthesis protein [Brevibacillus]MCR8984579.1 siderophore biosynthesis protein [Brevibacillus laterosporus]MCZ0830305.1 siderophore biosynthesis protein [Brevibacillus halotolerans]